MASKKVELRLNDDGTLDVMAGGKKVAVMRPELVKDTKKAKK